MSAWETERNALKNVLTDSEIQHVSPAVKEFLPEIHALIESKSAGDGPQCPKSLLGLGAFLRYYLIRCSADEFDSAVKAVSFPCFPHPSTFSTIFSRCSRGSLRVRCCTII